MRHPIRTLLVAAAAGLMTTGCANLGQAQLADPPTTVEMQQTTTGTRLESDSNARRVTVMTKEDIDRSGATNVGELLKGTGRR